MYCRWHADDIEQYSAHRWSGGPALATRTVTTRRRCNRERLRSDDVPIELPGIGLWGKIEPVVSPICLNTVPHRSRAVVVLKKQVGF
jgi:hypothetical protein